MANDLQVRQHYQTLMTQIGKAEALANKQQGGDTDQDRKVINYIFHKLQAICPAWQQSLAGMGHDEKEQLLKTIKREWLNSLMMEGISQHHIIDYALNCVKESGSPFLPTVGQFLGWCREGSIPDGIKTPMQAYKEVTAYMCLPVNERKPWGLSPEVYHTLASLGDVYKWKHMQEKEHRKYWEDEYKNTLETLRNGQPLIEAHEPKAFIENKRTPLDKEKAINQLREMRKGLG